MLVLFRSQDAHSFAQMKAFTVFGSVLLLSSALVTAPAAADPFTSGKLGISGTVAYAADLENDDLQPYNVGFGLQAGYTLPIAVPLYLGASFEQGIGDRSTTFVNERTVALSGSAWWLHGLLGYDLGLLDRVVLRPIFGLGPVNGRSEFCTSGICSSSTDTALSIAAGLQVPINLSIVTLTPQVKYLKVTDDAFDDAVNVGLGIGGEF